ncbi:UDP-N-acetylglucosamine--N-acetylmuramyl-(pentapeptide) pyrophosphoryl-undecaprenol N-acetylglucosamine transferase [Trichinella spiralis]|uniref:UDP-N-acetylglucosamine--N-acetylmuramyl-(Pentapeptide) pyrophosphoryl-undecaprenol N-acetylglucosamine transferase n=1 Tax=Trichinella spiralis TaxID=6334 RepID=A0ABR3KI83_TRISP
MYSWRVVNKGVDLLSLDIAIHCALVVLLLFDFYCMQVSLDGSVEGFGHWSAGGRPDSDTMDEAGHQVAPEMRSRRTLACGDVHTTAERRRGDVVPLEHNYFSFSCARGRSFTQHCLIDLVCCRDALRSLYAIVV